MEMTTIITQGESLRLIELENTIKAGLDTFVEVGNALLEIRDSRLYRVDHPTFEDYCKTKWGMSKPYAIQLICASNVVENLKTVAIATTPQNESQVRPLTKLKKPDQQREAWVRAVKSSPTGKPTAKLVKMFVDEILKSMENPVQPEQLNQGAVKSIQDLDERTLVTTMVQLEFNRAFQRAAEYVQNRTGAMKPKPRKSLKPPPDHWAVAKSHLDRIQDDDTSFDHVFQETGDYVQNRIANKAAKMAKSGEGTPDNAMSICAESIKMLGTIHRKDLSKKEAFIRMRKYVQAKIDYEKDRSFVRTIRSVTGKGRKGRRTR